MALAGKRDFLFVILGLMLFVWPSLAQTVPTTWRAPQFKETRDERIAVAHAALDIVAQNISLPSGITGMTGRGVASVFASLAMADLIANTTRYQAPITSIVTRLSSGSVHAFANPYDSEPPPNTDLLLMWSTMFRYAHHAYRDSVYLDLAKQAWTYTFPYFITEAHASAKFHPQMNEVIPATCSGHTVAGGVFMRGMANPKDYLNLEIGTASTAQFAMLSAYLADATKNDTYIKVAVLSATFLRDLLMETTGLLRDSMILSFPNECLSGSTPRKDGNPEVNHLNTYDSGLAMKAWIVVSDVSKDTQWRDLALRTMAVSSTSLFWSKDDGIIAPGVSSFVIDPGVRYENEGIVEALMAEYFGSYFELWSRNAGDPAIRSYIQAFVANQYHALRDFATKPGSNYYGQYLTGPTVDYWTVEGVILSSQILALSIGIEPVNAPSSSPTNTSTTDTNTSGTTNQTATSSNQTAGASTTIDQHSESSGMIVRPVMFGWVGISLPVLVAAFI